MSISDRFVSSAEAKEIQEAIKKEFGLKLVLIISDETHVPALNKSMCKQQREDIAAIIIRCEKTEATFSDGFDNMNMFVLYQGHFFACVWHPDFGAQQVKAAFAPYPLYCAFCNELLDDTEEESKTKLRKHIHKVMNELPELPIEDRIGLAMADYGRESPAMCANCSTRWHRHCVKDYPYRCPGCQRLFVVDWKGDVLSFPFLDPKEGAKIQV
jgi:hypothetical protein